jgi:DNA invertase Pin-like site-specific DNA recombinase
LQPQFGDELTTNSENQNFQLNGNHIQSKVMRTMLGLSAEIEHDLIVSRTREGLVAAKAEGTKLSSHEAQARAN